ncbi:MAG TPA: hypothetical protein VGW40_08265 [Allosphingosinicella sp.]|nr:hypothetical protein [Allosphingosinicella sp.]
MTALAKADLDIDIYVYGLLTESDTSVYNRQGEQRSVPALSGEAGMHLRGRQEAHPGLSPIKKALEIE